jgi:cation transporter-like permease
MLGSVLAGEVLAELKVSQSRPASSSRELIHNCVLQTWPVFLRVEELFILVPILLNLKGNLEMNLAARFSTSVSAYILST